MTFARADIVDLVNPGFYHCISRCVRRAFLCGKDCAHRKKWLEERLRLLTKFFAVDVTAFAMLDNHFHVSVYVDPTRVAGWTDHEVARRGRLMYPSGSRDWIRNILTDRLGRSPGKRDWPADEEASVAMLAADAGVIRPHLWSASHSSPSGRAKERA